MKRFWLAVPILLTGCQANSPYTYSNYDYNGVRGDLTFPEDRNHPYTKFYHDSKKEFQIPFEPRNEIDRQVQLTNEKVFDYKPPRIQQPFNDDPHSLALRFVRGFPGLEDKKVLRAETKWGWCRAYDCTVDAMNRKTSRSEVKPFKPARLGETKQYEFAFYIPVENNVLDGTENLHITQIKGGAEEIPSWIGIAPYQKKPDERVKRLIDANRVIDPNGYQITQYDVKDGGKPWVFDLWGSGIYQLDETVKTGDLVVFFRSILGIKDHVSRYMLKLADAKDIKGKWHHVKIDITWSRDPTKGALKYVFNNNTVFECNPCQTAPDHQFSQQSDDSGQYTMTIGAYRWINGNVINEGGTYFHEPRDVVVYYKDIAQN